MKRNVLLSAVAALAIAVGLSGAPASAQTTTGMKVGALTCDVASGWGLVFGSTRDLKCTYSDNNGSVERYTGHINKFGADIGYHAGGAVVWAVIAPTTLAKGALAGNYGGVTGGAAIGIGAAANVLVGGSGQTVSLQPVSFEGITGLNVAAGIEQVVLTAAE